MKTEFRQLLLHAVFALGFSAGLAQAQSGDPTVTQAVAGENHTCALTSAGGVKCWGMNDYGQLGNTATSVTNPNALDVQTLGSGVAAIAAGFRHTCALTDQGAVKCWGAGGVGRLGNASASGTRNDSPLPVQTLGQGVVAITAGEYHTCALTDRGAVKCWGWNKYGQLGSATNAGADGANVSPLDVQTLGSGVVAISAAQSHVCAVTQGGAVKCWGSNAFGQLGNAANLGTEAANDVPLAVPTLASGVAGVAAGMSHSCAVLGGNTAKCWGMNHFGQLGNPSNAGSAMPNTSPLDVWTSGRFIATGALHTCLAADDGILRCWGSNEFGQLGVMANAGTTAPNSTPAVTWNPAVFGVGIGSVAGGFRHGCAVTTTGSLHCWGSNSNGQLGRGTSGGFSSSLAGVQGLSATTSGQSIAFTAPSKLRLGTSISLAATASSGNAVVFDTWTPGSCVVNGTTLSPAAGASDGMLCGVRASQPGTANIPRAPQQLRVIRIVREDRLSLSVAGDGTVSATPAPLAGNGISACAAANSPCMATYVSGDATSVTFSATPAANWHIAGWSGNCTANGANPQQASAMLAGDTTCSAVFAINTFTVSAAVTGGNGTIAPASRTVNHGATTTFSVAPAEGYQASVSGCGGSLSGTTYTTAAITANCAVTASFSLRTYTVTATAGANGTITPPSRSVNHGATTTFSVTPAKGYQASASGCGGSLSGNTYTTGIITNACAVTASFAASPPDLSLTITADRSHVRYGQVLSYAVTLSNNGTGAANPASIALTLPPQLNPSGTTWTCTNGGAGAQCTAAGSGALLDNGVVLPAGRSLTWLVSAPVRTDASGGDIITNVAASAGAVNASASHRAILVLLRDGFESIAASVANGDGVSCVEEPSAAESDPSFAQRFTLPDARGLFDTVLVVNGQGGSGLRVQRASPGDGTQLQLIATDADGRENASRWGSVVPGAVPALVVAADVEHKHHAWLDGTAEPLAITLPAWRFVGLRVPCAQTTGGQRQAVSLPAIGGGNPRYP